MSDDTPPVTVLRSRPFLRSVRGKLALGVGLVLMVFLVVAAGRATKRESEMLTRVVDNRNLRVANSLATVIGQDLAGDPKHVTTLFQNLDWTENFNLTGLSLLAPGGKVHSEFGRTHRGDRVAPDGSPLTEIEVPVPAPAPPGHTLLLRFDRHTLDSGLDRVRYFHLSSALLFLIPTLLITWLLARAATRPLVALSSAADEVGRGHLEVALPAPSDDEIGDLVRSFEQMIQGLRHKERMRRYLSRSAWSTIEEDTLGVDGGKSRSLGERRVVTVLFSDLRGYTALSKTLPPDELVNFINTYLSIMTEAVTRYDGVVDKYIGDGTMAVFYSDTIDDSAKRAVFAALDMVRAVENENKSRISWGFPSTSVGIGIESGEVIAGDVGTELRCDYTVIGSTVNRAAKLEKVSKLGKHTKIAIGEATLGAIRGLVSVAPIDLAKHSEDWEALGTAHEIVRIRSTVELTGQLSSASPEERRDLLRALGWAGEPSVFEPLSVAADDPSPGMRLEAVLAFREYGNRFPRETEIFLLSRLATESDSRVLATLVQCLGSIPGFAHHDTLTEFLDHADPRVRANAIEALANRPDPNLTIRFGVLLEDRNNRVKANAALALLKRGQQSVIEMLERMLSDVDPAMRASAVFALGELGTLRSAELLIGALERGETEVFYTAVRALSRTADVLLRALLDKDRATRLRAIEGLGKIGDRRALPALLAVASSGEPDTEIRQSALKSARRIGLPPEVLRVFISHQSENGNGAPSARDDAPTAYTANL